MSFSQGALLLSILIWNGFLLFYFIAVRNPRFTRSLPRHRGLGLPLALICLFWSAWHVSLMLEGGMARYQDLVFILVPVVAILAYYFLSYLFTRAFGGLLLLLTSWLLHAAFGVFLPARPVFSIFAYLVAITGAVMIAFPWCFRDLLESAIESVRVRQGTSLALAFSAVVFLVFALLGWR